MEKEREKNNNENQLLLKSQQKSDNAQQTVFDQFLAGKIFWNIICYFTGRWRIYVRWFQKLKNAQKTDIWRRQLPQSGGGLVWPSLTSIRISTLGGVSTVNDG